MLPRTLEPEVMDTDTEAADYDQMDHSSVNRVFVDDLLTALSNYDSAVASSTVASSTRNVFDAGTGTAQIPIELCRRDDFSGHVVAADLASAMLKVAARNVERAGLTKRIALLHADCKQVKRPDGEFDVVMSNSIVHHIPRPQLALAEMIRLVRPGGLLFVRDLCRPCDIEELDRLAWAYAGRERPSQFRMFRDSLCAALTVPEVRHLLIDLELPAGWANRTSDRHWTICGRVPVGQIAGCD